MKLAKAQFKDLAELSMLTFSKEESEHYMKDLDLIIDFTQKSQQTQTQQEPMQSIFTLQKKPSLPIPEAGITQATFNQHFSDSFFRISNKPEKNTK